MSNKSAFSLAFKTLVALLALSSSLSFAEGNETHVVIRTEDGKELQVTCEHPMLLASGEIVLAETLQAGQILLTADGTPVNIVSLNFLNPEDGHRPVVGLGLY